ncbi:hypothetical protein ABZP36_035999 [Zizania latifolia]
MLLSGTIPVSLLSWGRGASGQLGGGKEERRLYRSPVANLSFYDPEPILSPTAGRLPAAAETAGVEVGISCVLFHSALLVDGGAWVWGKGDGGRLGLGDESSAFVPRPNPNLSDLRILALGGIHSAALTASGDVFTWGYGGFGALGHYAYHRELLPRQVNGPWEEKISHIATSGAHTAAITDSGELYTWGRDEGDGRLGLGSGGGPGEAGSLSVPSKVNSLPVPVAAVACGGFFAMALTSDGQLWSWGGAIMAERELINKDKLVLRGLRFHGFHGVKQEEKTLGQKFVVDVDAWMDLSIAGESDNISDTVSYTDIYRIVKDVVEGPSLNLLEAVAHRISSATLLKFPQISAIRVKVEKPHVDVQGIIDYLGVEILRYRKDI